MSVSGTTNRVSYTGDGSTVNFSFPHYFQSTSELVVILRLTSTKAETTQTIVTHYSITGTATNGVYLSGGTVTFVTAPASTYKVIIYRNPALTTDLDLVENDSLPAESLEQKVDKLVLIAQRLNEALTRGVRLTDGQTDTFTTTLPVDIATANKILAVNASGTGFMAMADSSSVTEIAASATAAAASASAAATSASAASTSATAAASSASAAATSASAASTSATAAASSASSASTSATAAAASAALAAASSGYSAVVAGDGTGTHTTIASAIAAVSAGQAILIKPGTYTENLTISKQVFIEGRGRGCIISGTVTFDANSDWAELIQVKVTGNITLQSGADGVHCDVIFGSGASYSIDAAVTGAVCDSRTE